MAESREDRYVAALCHASVLLPLFGTVLPIVIWLTQRARSPLLRFQALQAFAYQLIGLLAYLIIYLCQMIAVFSAFLIVPVSFLFSGAPSTSPPVSSTGPEGVVAFLLIIVFFLSLVLMMGLNFVQCIGWPLFVVAGLWAAWRILGGRAFHYPMLGRWLAKRLDPAP